MTHRQPLGALLDVLVETLPMPAAVVDARGQMVSANDRWRRAHELSSVRSARQPKRTALPGVGVTDRLILLVLERRRAGHPPGAHAKVVTPGALTAREREVATLIAEGMRNADIAASLRISTATARRHTERILRKLDVPSRSGVAAVLASGRRRHQFAHGRQISDDGTTRHRETSRNE